MPYEKSVLVPLGADETFALITQPDRLRRWQAITARVDLRAGGAYRWTIVPGHTVCGTFTEVEPGRRVVFTWGWEDSGELPPGASTVIVTLEPAEGGTLVRLVHEGLTGEQAASHAEGWSHYLDRLVTPASSHLPDMRLLADITPASFFFTTGKLVDGMKQSVVRILNKRRTFSSADNDDTASWLSVSGWRGGSEMHGKSHWTKHAIRMVH